INSTVGISEKNSSTDWLRLPLLILLISNRKFTIGRYADNHLINILRCYEKYRPLFPRDNTKSKWEEKSYNVRRWTSCMRLSPRCWYRLFILEDFDIYGARESSASWVIELREKEGRIPVLLCERSDVVFDGYCNPIETLSHSFVCKPVYLKIYRRRYKKSNNDEHFSNEYDFTLKGLKMEPELVFFKRRR
ncbi:hypothetical protein EZS27_035178, partial [termite gut metagenome]